MANRQFPASINCSLVRAYCAENRPSSLTVILPSAPARFSTRIYFRNGPGSQRSDRADALRNASLARTCAGIRLKMRSSRCYHLRSMIRCSRPVLSALRQAWVDAAKQGSGKVL